MSVRTSYQQALQALQDEMLVLASMAEKAVGRSVDALVRRDLDAARQIITADNEIDEKRYDIEEKAIHLIATQQPMARDLRIIVAILNIIVELERIGDYAEGIAKIVLHLGDQPPLKRLIDIPKMADKARDMLRRSLDAYVARDAALAIQIAAEDDEVDALYDRVYHELLDYMIADRDTITRATYLIWVSHNLERIADRTTNICERVVFLTTGRLADINTSRY
jgi:phosphate transport system protein